MSKFVVLLKVKKKSNTNKCSQIELQKSKKGVIDKSSVYSTKVDREMVAQNQDSNGGFMVKYSCKQKNRRLTVVSSAKNIIE